MVKITQFYFKILFFLASILGPTLGYVRTSSAAGSDRQIFFIKVHKLNHYRYTECYKLHKLFCHYEENKGICKESTIRGHRKTLSPWWDSLQIYASNSKKLNLVLFIFTVVIRTYTVLYINYLNNDDILSSLVLCKLTCTVLTVLRCTV